MAQSVVMFAIDFTINLIVDVRFRLACYTRQLHAQLPEAFIPVLVLSSTLLLLTMRLSALDTARTLDQFSYQTWQSGSGLPQNSVHSILQSRDGFIWLATEGGLVRFDGYQFVVFDSRNTPAFKSNNIRSLLEDQEGSLWIGTAEGVSRRRGDRIDAFPANSILSGGNIQALHNDHSGGMWIITSDEIAQWNSGASKPLSPRFSLPEGTPRLTGAFASGTSGLLWIGTQGGLKFLQHGRLQDAPGNLPTVAVTSLLFDHSARLWVGTAKGLFVSETLDPNRFQPVCVSLPGAALSLFEDWERNIWVGTESGPVRLVNGSTEPCQSAKALSGVAAISMAEDAEGDLWIGSESNGVTVARNQKFVTYTAKNGLSDDSIRCVFEDRPGSLSIGTKSGLARFEDNRFTQFTTSDGLSSNVVLSLGADRENHLLVGTPDGLNRSLNGKFAVTTSSDGLPDDFVRSLYRDADGSLWIGTRRGLSHEDLTGHFRTFTQANGLGSDLVGAILRDHHGDLWIGTLGGLSRLSADGIRNFRRSDGLSSEVITALYEDPEGDLWIGTGDAGLNLLSHGKIARVPASLGLPNGVFGVAEDLNGEFWIPSKAGIARVNRAELKNVALRRDNRATVAWYDTSDGLQINECSVGGHPDVWKAHDGTLWFSTVKGIAALYPAAAHLNRVLPPVAIESVRIDDQLFAPSQVEAVAPGHSRFSFEYAGLSFAAPHKVLYRYKLEGFEKDWIEAGTQRTAYYTNIPPGDYRFRVSARNNDGFWNETGALMSFRIRPHFYQTLWFYSLLALVLAGGCYLIYRWRVAEVEARFTAVLQERNRIAREIHDTLAQGFVGVSMQLEIVSRLLSSSVDSAREHLDQARLQVREGLTEARRSIWQLRSHSADSEDLAGRVSKAATRAIDLNPVKLTFEVRGTYRPLRAPVEDELLRISQEAVANALRHAKAGRITIELAYASKTLRMIIADDGCGFNAPADPASLDGHYGLKGMRERAEQINAQLAVQSEAGKGTKVIVEASLV